MGGKKTNASSMTKEQCAARLEEIASLSMGALGYEEALAIIKERKDLEALLKEYDDEERAVAERERADKRAAELRASIDEIDKAISPEKSDEELISLIERRRSLKAELAVSRGGEAAAEEVPDVDTRHEDEPASEGPEKAVSGKFREEFGREGISTQKLEVTGELKQYLDELSSSTSSLGTFLQRLPAEVRANRTFMLKVAETDPAYAMHYADATLRKDGGFCLLIAEMPNKRNSGNALAEMDPDGRTSEVVMAGVKQDYRNIRFAAPDMDGYREMLEIAKRGALHKIRELKDGADAILLVPKVLQKDQEFMREVNAAALSGEDSSE